MTKIEKLQRIADRCRELLTGYGADPCAIAGWRATKSEIEDILPMLSPLAQVIPEAWNRIMEQIQSGRSQCEVADEFGVTHQAITYRKNAKRNIAA